MSGATVLNLTPTRFAAAALGIADHPPPADRKGKIAFGACPSCWLCSGPTDGRGWQQADAFPGTFTQFSCAVLPDSDAVCQPCVAMTTGAVFKTLVTARGLDIKLWSQCGWHSYSHLVTGRGDYEAPKPGRVREILLDPPEPPFVLGLNPSGQKHSLFRTRVAASRDLFPLHYDERTFMVGRGRFAALLTDLERMSALGFSKEQSETGRYHPESIRRAGLAAWRAGEARMALWRASEPDLLDLAAWVGRGPKWFADNGQAIERAPPPGHQTPLPAQRSLFA